MKKFHLLPCLILLLGNSQGCIQVFNLGTGLLTREYTIHTCAVK